MFELEARAAPEGGLEGPPGVPGPPEPGRTKLSAEEEGLAEDTELLDRRLEARTCRCAAKLPFVLRRVSS